MQSYYNTPVKIVNYGKSLTKRDFHLQNGISDYKMCFSFTKWDSRVTNGNLVLQFIDKRLNDDYDDYKRGICLMFMLILSMNTFIIILLGGLRYDDI